MNKRYLALITLFGLFLGILFLMSGCSNIDKVLPQEEIIIPEDTVLEPKGCIMVYGNGSEKVLPESECSIRISVS